MSDLLDTIQTEVFGSDTFTLDASFGGVPFAMIDSRDPPGRRALRFMFPGLDDPAFQDLGQDDGEIRVGGIIVGKDYISRADDLRQAFRTPGPQTLVHPWLGSVQVVLSGRPEISFVHDELGVARFTATFWLYTAGQPQDIDTEEGLLDRLNDLRQQAYGLLNQVLGRVSQVLSVVAYARNFVGSIAGFFALAIDDASGITSELLGPAAAPALAALAGVGGLPLGDSLPSAGGALLAAPSAALVTAAQPPIPSAVASAYGTSAAPPGTPGSASVPVVTTVAPAADPRITTTVLLAVASAVAAKAGDPAPGPALALVTQALVVADAVTAASDIVYTSQQDAAQWSATLQAAIGALANAAMLQGAAYPALAGAVWRAAIASSAALSADMNAQIGRLPAVVVITPPAPVPVWLLAQYVSGDTPGAVFATYLDLVARNAIRNPATPPAGAIEALQG